MAQAEDYDIVNAIGSAVRSDLNDVFGAVATLNAGTVAPSPSPTSGNPKSYAYMLWADIGGSQHSPPDSVAANKLRMRNGSNSAWVEIGDLDQTGLNIVASKFPNISSNVTPTSAEINKLDGLTATTTELNIVDGLTATTSELNTLDGITATTSELNTLDGITATTSELNIMDGVLANKFEINTLDMSATISGASTTGAVLTSRGGSTNANWQTGFMRASERICLFEGSNGTPSNGIFSSPTSARQLYTITPSSDFSLSTGTFLSMYMEFECVNNEDGFVVGDVIPRVLGSTIEYNNHTWPVWHTNSGDMSNTSMRVKFRMGDDPVNALMHQYTRPTGSSANTNYLASNFALYARIFYIS